MKLLVVMLFPANFLTGCQSCGKGVSLMIILKVVALCDMQV